MAKEKYSAQQMATALRDTRGMVTIAAKQLGCDYNTVQRYIREYPTVAAAQKLARETLGDNVEITLATMALGKVNPSGKYDREPNIAALIFLAKTKYKDRGYVERTEQVNFNVDTALIQRAIEAIEQQGLSASDVFNNIIASAVEETHSPVTGANGAGEGARAGE